MSHFPAELTITLTDGNAITECFNQVEMAQFTRERMLARLQKGLPLVIYDGERIEVDPERVASLNVVVQSLVRS
jgi:hypothetical protein